MNKWQRLYLAYCILLIYAALLITSETEFEQPTYELVETIENDIELRKYQPSNKYSIIFNIN